MALLDRTRKRVQPVRWQPILKLTAILGTCLLAGVGGLNAVDALKAIMVLM